MRIHLWNINISYFIYWRSILRIKLRWIWHLRNTLNNGVDVLKLVLVILILDLKVKIWRLMLIIINWAFLIILVVRINLILILVFYHILRWEIASKINVSVFFLVIFNLPNAFNGAYYFLRRYYFKYNYAVAHYFTAFNFQLLLNFKEKLSLTF